MRFFVQSPDFYRNSGSDSLKGTAESQDGTDRILLALRESGNVFWGWHDPLRPRSGRFEVDESLEDFSCKSVLGWSMVFQLDLVDQYVTVNSDRGLSLVLIPFDGRSG